MNWDYRLEPPPDPPETVEDEHGPVLPEHHGDGDPDASYFRDLDQRFQ